MIYDAVFYILILLFILIIIGAYFYLIKKPQEKVSIKDLYAEGLDMLVTGQRKSAYRKFKEIINQDSNNVKAYLHLGQVMREGGNVTQALKIHTNLLHRRDLSSYEKIELYKNLVFNYENLNNSIQAVKYCDKILQLDKKNEWAMKYLIKLYKNQDDWSNAIESLKAYLKLKKQDNNHMLALYNIQRGRSVLKNGDYSKSRQIFENVLELDSDMFISYYFLGNTYKEESNFIFNKSIEIKQDNSGSLENNEKSEKLKEKAEKILSKAILMWVHFIENMPEYSWLILPTMKDALQALNRYDDIEKILMQIKNKNSHNLDIISHLADFYANKGEVDKALNTINSGLSKAPNSLIGQLKKVKIIALQKKENEISSEIDKLIQSLLTDDRYKTYKYNFSDSDLNWLFEYNDINYE